MSADPYADPVTGVLVNLLGLDDADELSRSEAEIVTARSQQLRSHPIRGSYDVAHLQAFHRHLFGDVYPWAGSFRTVNLARSAEFGSWEHLQAYLDDTFEQLARENHLGGLGHDDLVIRLAHYLAKVNAAHPFREGNGRTQRAFFRQLAADRGWSMHWSRIGADENAAASEASLMGNLRPLEEILLRIIEPHTKT